MTDHQNKFLLYGFFGGWNSGDEAILRTVIRMMRHEYGNPEIVVLCARINEPFWQEYRDLGIGLVTAKEFSKITALLTNHRLIVGGGQMITGDHRYRGLIYLAWLTTTAAFKNAPARFIGAGVEGVHRPFAKWLCRRIVARCEWFGCRDDYSRSMLLSAGCSPEKLRLTADVVLSGVINQSDKKLSPGAELPIEIKTKEGPIALGLHRSPLRSYADINTYRGLIETLLKVSPRQEVQVVSNDSRPSFDAGLLEELKKYSWPSRVSFVPFESVEKTIAAYANASCVVSVRMHPLILGLIHSVPVLGIRRSNKVEHLSRMTGFPLFDPETDSEDKVIEALRLAIDSVPNRIDDLSRRAWQNFE